MIIHYLGHIVLWCALIFSFTQSAIPLWGYARQNPYALAFARPSAFLQFFCVFCAYLLLTLAFIGDEYSITYVASNSHPALPFIYKLTATWGAHEGSILLWILILNVWTIFFSFFTPTPRLLQTLTLSILGIISFFFLCFLIFTSDPFVIHSGIDATPIKTPPLDLNPLLQDPGLVSHPPMLYMGYVGFSVAFAITIAALIINQLDSPWAKITRRFAIFAWSFLTLGIVLGSLWAYRVLGWGGFWFWDPVENASLLPWLSGTALIHALVLVEKRETAQRVTILLALVCFALSLLGTFLVRSGVLISAHTFANDPKRGLFLLLLLALIISAALVLYFIRAPRLNIPTAKNFALVSRESKLLLNSALLCLAMLTVLIGTLYPLIIDALHLGTISVGAPYFNIVMLPINIVVMIFMGIAPFCKWQKQDLKELMNNIWKKAVLSIVVASALLWSLSITFDLLMFVNLSLSFWIINSVISEFRLRPAMAVAHTGFALLIIGIMLSSTLGEEREVRLKVGHAVDLGPYQFFFLATQAKNGPNYRGIEATFDVIKNKHHITYLYPEKRMYPVRSMVMTKADIHPSIFRDLYIALGDPFTQEDWSLRIYYKPFIRFIWIGGLLMMLGGLVAVFNRVRPIRI